MVLGADSVLGALAAAALLVSLDAGTRGGLAAALIGVLAVLAGRLPNGLHDKLRTGAPVRGRAPRLTDLGTRTRTRLRPAPEGPRVPRPTGLTAWRGAGQRGRVTGPAARADHTARRPARNSRAGPPGDGGPTAPPDRSIAPLRPPPGTGTSPEKARPGARPDAGPPARGEPTAPPDRPGTPPRLPAGRETHRERAREYAESSPSVVTPPDETQAGGPADTDLTAHGEPTTRPAKPGAPSRGRLRPAEAGAAPAAKRARAGPEARASAGPPLPAGPAPAGACIEASGLRARYGGFTALAGVGLVVPPGGITAVVGPNGAGKSTLFHCLAGTHRPARGQVLLGERDVTRLPAHVRPGSVSPGPSSSRPSSPP